jgi:uncharacterized protein (DUF1684 family)
MTALDDFRKEKDEFFKHDPQSPLDPQQQRDFTGLQYFPENPALHLQLALEPASQPRPVTMQTSTGDVREYVHAGQVRFVVDGQEVALLVYQYEYGYFLPFIDATAPDETYGAGRYLEPHDLGNGTLDVDFNLAYNPYCAYNERWSCPLPPKENRLGVRIEAGEKKYHD